jgi:ATP-dependent metalloprotease
MYDLLVDKSEKDNKFIYKEYEYARTKLNNQRLIFNEVFSKEELLNPPFIKWRVKFYMFFNVVAAVLFILVAKKFLWDGDSFEGEEPEEEEQSDTEAVESEALEHKESPDYMLSLPFSWNPFKGTLADMTSNFEIKYAKGIKERLGNIKGIEEVREEIDELISMLKNPEAYIEAGAKLPKGVLLCGKPGTGKTLIARAIAGEAGVNFIYLTGSDFDEMYVGVGAARMRKLFKAARENSPCIIFIDEIDSLLAASRRKGEHSSSRATINQFLAEMDGFKKLDKILVIGATNHEKDLDPAAVRPGRFDKKIHINVPDETGRMYIIKFYLDKIKLEKKGLDPQYIAKLTPGFTGAEIENLINLAIVRAVNLNKKEVDIEDISESRDRVFMGIANKNYSMSDKKRYHTALHEAGHTLICYKSQSCRKTLDKVTVIPRGAALGVTMRLSDEEALNSKNEYLEFIDMCMGGHVAEELIYGNDHVTAGCSSDLDKATNIAQSMVKKYGMYGQKVGYIYVEDEGYTWEEDTTSDKYKTIIDETVKSILKDSHDRVYKTLEDNAGELKNIAQCVFQHDTLNCNILFNI